ncbi:MAG: hypothetical protein ACHQQQ_14620 [Bacteroidota bacterium]
MEMTKGINLATKTAGLVVDVVDELYRTLRRSRSRGNVASRPTCESTAIDLIACGYRLINFLIMLSRVIWST